MKVLPILAAILGVAAMAVLVGYFGAGAVLRSLLAVGGTGFVAICAIHLALTVGMGLAWHALLPGIHPGIPIWARLVRDSGSEALPLSQVGGYVLGARALSLAGVPGTVLRRQRTARSAGRTGDGGALSSLSMTQIAAEQVTK